ncbi:MAG: AGCS family alanine or glycine:cation symporter [Arenicella sp.]|jgi:AGCS family alanine or glycine:cation symporter
MRKITLLLLSLGIFFSIAEIQAQDYKVSVKDNPTSGTVTLSESGDFKYTPNTGFAGADKFTYEICNEGDCKPANVNITVREYSIDDNINTVFTPITRVLQTIVFFSIPIDSEKFTPTDDSFTSEIGSSVVEGNVAGNDFSTESIPFVLIWLVVGAIFFTIFMKFVNFTAFKHALDVVRGKYDDPNKDVGEVSHFQALTAALSGTVGVGNIAGVALAISAGGPGATFWMIMAGLVGMSSKFVECTLGVKYRNINEDGSVSGGPMYYLSKGLAKHGKAGLGKFLAAFFAIACIGGSLGGGNMVQINQATQQFIDVTGGEASFLFGKGYIFGIVMAGVVGLIIIGGIKSIAKVTDKVVPFMVGIYVLAALVVIFANIGEVPTAFGEILAGAFTPKGMYGGLIGVLIVGIQRAAFSNEAGIGSASIAHSAAKTDEPISEGVVALLEPFIDTVVVCTMTALVIVITGKYGGTTAGITLTSQAFGSVISWFPTVLSVAVILFALSTMISWSYYGLKAWTYLLGDSKAMEVTYKALYCVFVVIGSALSIGSVFDFGDAMIFAMAFPNVLGLYFLAPEIKQDLISYMKRIKSGEIKRFD